MDIENATYYSDDTGKATFSGFLLARGPEGMYGFRA